MNHAFYTLILSYSPSPFTHSCTSASSAPERNLSPSCQSPVPAISSNSCPLSPIPEDADVQNGITVFPVKSLFSTKLSTGHAAMPHQIGYTMGIKAEMWQKMSNRKIPQSPGGLRYVVNTFYFLADVRRFLCTSLPCSPLTGITDRKGVVSPSSIFDEGIIKGDF